MITHYLGEQEIVAYSRDLAKRLLALGNATPTLWVAVGTSGFKMAQRVLPLLPRELIDQIEVATVHFDRKNDAVKFVGFEASELPISADRPVFVIDSAVHSGRSLLAVIRAIRDLGATNVMSYSLVLKLGSIMVPTLFGVVIEDKDRTYFDLDVLPNNRLSESQPFGVLRTLSPDDRDLEIVDIGAPFEGLTAGDLLYEEGAKGFRPFIYEFEGKIAGFVSFRKSGRKLFIDGWGTAEAHRGKGIGAAMMRWAETWGRASKCEEIELWAYETAISTYVKLGYRYSEPDFRDLGKGGRYRIMNRAILYNIKVSDGEVDYR